MVIMLTPKGRFGAILQARLVAVTLAGRTGPGVRSA
jgi:hypothetical protein